MKWDTVIRGVIFGPMVFVAIGSTMLIPVFILLDILSIWPA